jgi:hypothetical protein
MIPPILTGIYIKVSRLPRIQITADILHYNLHFLICITNRTGISNNFDIFIINLRFINAIDDKIRKQNLSSISWW